MQLLSEIKALENVLEHEVERILLRYLMKLERIKVIAIDLGLELHNVF